jgi:RND superfamily putative drug exporter
MRTAFRRGARLRHRLPRRALSAVRRYTPAIAAAWILVPLALWFVALQAPPAPMPQPPLLPNGVTGTAGWSHNANSGADQTVLGQLVISADRPLDTADRAYYEALIARLRSDTAHVESAVASWSDPLTADIATSADQHGAYGLLWLHGAAGSARAQASADAVTAAIAAVPAPPGAHAQLTGPATMFAVPLSPSWSTAAAIVAAVLALIAAAIVRVCRPTIRLAVLAGTAGAALFAAAPVIYLLASLHLLTLTPMSVALGAILTACAAIDFAVVITRGYHRQRRVGDDHEAALTDAYGALLRRVVVAAPVLTAMLAASHFLHTPLLHEVTVPSAIGLPVALLAVVALVPGMIGRSAESAQWTQSWAARRLRPAASRRRLLATAAALCAVLIGATAISTHNTRSAGPTEAGPFSPGQLLPDVVTVDADHDLRTPDGLATINTITHKLLALPGVVRVQSASAPAGTPWDQATFAFQAGTLGRQAQKRAGAASGQLGPVKALSSHLDALDGAINRVRRGGPIADVSRAFAEVGAGMLSIQRAATAVANSVAPIQEWMQGVSNCSGNASCLAAQRLLAPFGNVLRVVADLSASTTAMFSGPQSGTPAAPADPLTQLQSVIRQLRAQVPALSRMLDTVLPQIGSLATSMTGIGHRFGTNNQGAFYLPTSAINAEPYRTVRDSMFSTDGRSTRLLVYGALDHADLPLWQRPAAIAQVLTVATKDATLSDIAVTVSGTGTVALQLRDLARHDATALALCFLIATALAAGAMARHRRTLLLLSALAVAFLLVGAVVWLSVTDIVIGEITWLAVLFAMAVGGPMAVHHHISMAGRSHAYRPLRQPANVLCLAGVAFGLALWLISGDTLLHRSGLLMAIGLSANAATVTLSRRGIAAVPARAVALWSTLTTGRRPAAPLASTPRRPTPALAAAALPVLPRRPRPPAVRPRLAPDCAVSRSTSRRAKALLRQQYFVYLQGPVADGSRPRIAAAYQLPAPSCP